MLLELDEKQMARALEGLDCLEQRDRIRQQANDLGITSEMCRDLIARLEEHKA